MRYRPPLPTDAIGQQQPTMQSPMASARSRSVTSVGTMRLETGRVEMVIANPDQTPQQVPLETFPDEMVITREFIARLNEQPPPRALSRRAPPPSPP
jgi:hypothetical protein